MPREKLLFYANCSKLVIVPACLTWLTVSVFSEESADINLSIGVLALLVNAAGVVALSERMKLSLQLYGIFLNRADCVRINVQSMFYFFVLPMTVGLEASRFLKIRTIMGASFAVRKTTMGLLSDRVAGAVVAGLVAIATLPLVDVIPRSLSQVLTLAALLGSFFLLLLTSTNIIRIPRRNFHVLLLWASSSHLMLVLAGWLAAIAFGLQYPFYEIAFVISASLFFVLVPVSLGGASPVEAATFGGIILIGGSTDEAALFSLSFYLLKLVVAGAGGLWEFIQAGEFLTKEDAKSLD